MVDPGLSQPYTDKFSVGVNHELMRNLAVGASYIHKRQEDFPRPDRHRQHLCPVRLCRSRDRSNVHALQSYDALVSAIDPTDEPHAIQLEVSRGPLSLTKRLAQRWQAIGSLTISKNEGMNAGTNRRFGQNQSSLASNFGEDPNDFINAYGLMPADRKYMWKLQSTYWFPYHIGLSANWQYLSGVPYVLRLQTRLNQGTRRSSRPTVMVRCGRRRSTSSICASRSG